MKENKQTTETKTDKKIVKKAIIAVLVLAIVLGVVYYCLSPDEVEADVARQASITQTLTEVGVIASDDPITIYAPVSGRISTVAIKTNDEVDSGSVLAGYDLTSFENSLKIAELNIDYHEDGYQAAVSDNKKNKAKMSYSQKTADDFLALYVHKEEDMDRIGLEQNKKSNYIQSSMKGIESAIANMSDELELKKHNEASESELNDLKNKIAASREALASLPTDSMDNATYEQYSQMKRELDVMEKAWNLNIQQKQAAEEKVVSDDQIEQYADSVELAKVEQEKAQRDLTTAQNGVISPVKAVVTQRFVDEGSYVEAGTPLFVIQPLGDYKAVVKVSRLDIEQVKEGQSATVKIGQTSYNGTVDRIVPVAETDTSGRPRVRVEISLDDATIAPTIGLEADIEIFTGTEDSTLSISEQALYTGDDGDYVYVIEDGKVNRRAIVTGTKGDGRVQVLEGISEGEYVITAPQTDDDIGTRVVAAR